jgi:sporulation protein YlmC with PRC-barrel domain
MNRSTGIGIEGDLDAQIDLLDRQIVSSDGQMIANVDDVELEERGDLLVISGLLVGPGALGPRLGGVVGGLTVRAWQRLSHHEEASRIDYTHVQGIDTIVTIDERRRDVDIDGLEAWTRTHVVDALPGAGEDREDRSTESSRLGDGPDPAGTRHRLGPLERMSVQLENGATIGRITDVRVRRGDDRGHLPELVVDGLLIGRYRLGTLFGYDRDRQRGPWLIRMVLRPFLRQTGYVRWSDVGSIDWEEGVVVLTVSELDPLPEHVHE